MVRSHIVIKILCHIDKMRPMYVSFEGDGDLCLVNDLV